MFLRLVYTIKVSVIKVFDQSLNGMYFFIFGHCRCFCFVLNCPVCH